MKTNRPKTIGTRPTIQGIGVSAGIAIGPAHVVESQDEAVEHILSDQVKAGDIVVGDTEGYIHVIDIDSGIITGRARLSDEAIIARPVATEDAMFVQTTDGVVGAYRFAR